VHVLARLGVKFVVLVFAAAIACAAAPAGDRAGKPIARGVRVGDVVLGGLSSQPARERVRRDLTKPLFFRVGAQTVRVPAGRFQLDADVDRAVRTALGAQPGASIRLRVQLDRHAVDRTVATLARRFYRPARDATVSGLDASLRPVFGPSAPGRKLDRRAARREIRHVLASGTREDIRLAFLRVRPSVTVRDLGSVIVIRRSSNTLTLFNGRNVVRIFRVATGQAIYPTPLGQFEIVDKQYNPWWYPPPSPWATGLKPVPPGPGNPLGTRWMGLSAPGVGMHGTPDAASIGYSASHGCIRMYVPDAEWLFDHVDIGTPVFIVSA
jgi:lipoprotein-anchoring transpeptidase ErfK/SrfK